jgi:hypothetical protein
MTHTIYGITLTIFCCVAGFTAALSAAETPSNSNVEALVRKLGDERFSTRQQADEELREMGEPLADQLRAFRDDPNPEIRARVQGVLDYIASLRRELTWIDPKDLGKRENRSTMGLGIVKLTFRNLSKKPVRIFWIQSDGSHEAWRGELKPGATAICARSYTGHVWLVTDAKKKPLGVYKIDLDDPVIAVRDENVEK